MNNKLYWAIGIAIILIIVIVIINRNKTKQADAAIVATNQQISALNNIPQSQFAQILNSLFPYFQTGISAAQTKG